VSGIFRDAHVTGACKEELAPNPKPALSPELAAQEKATQDCVKAGGTPVIDGFGIAICQTKIKDGGKSCSSSDECEGFFLAEGEMCTSHSPHFGCFETYENGQRPTLCVD
jgi:hypothetical protein